MRIVIIGPAGKMGRQVVKEASGRPVEFMIVGGVVPEERPYIRLDISRATGGDFVGATLYDDLEFCIPISEGVLDFSTPEATVKNLKKAVEYKRPVIIGTTGFNEKQMGDIKYYSKKIPVFLGISPEGEEIIDSDEAREKYAKDALEAMQFMKKRRPGIYTYQDLVNFRNGIEPEEPENESPFDGGIDLW